MPKKKKRAGVSGRRHKYHYLKKTKLKHENSENVNLESNFECDSIQMVQPEFTDVDVHFTIQTNFEDVCVQAIPETCDISVQTIESESDHTYAKSCMDYSSDDSFSNAELNSSVNESHAAKEQIHVESIYIDCGDEVVESLSFKEFSSAIKKGLSSKTRSYCVHETESELTLIDFYVTSEGALAVKLTVRFNNDFTCNVHVHRKEIPRSHSLWECAPEVFHTSKDAFDFLERLDKFLVCCGNSEAEFQQLVSVGSGLTNSSSNDTCIVAYREGNFGAQYQSTIRSSACEMLTLRLEKCPKCKDYGYALTKRIKRIEERKANPRRFSHSTFKHSNMTRDELCSKLIEQKNEIGDLSNEVRILKRQLERAISKNGVEMSDHGNIELNKSFATCTCSEEVKQSFPDSNSRQRLFWEQQELAAKVPSSIPGRGTGHFRNASSVSHPS
ncbi:uncharacterized protein LOC127858741 [Dreissena polymorpha]|uniref:uncharacterized protein LOC127858741 n=1 Tax=Dreissena polymorpha TaxID=45954 RepID=UPI0022653256|nr:uncharacterized protein LOC127858741 [Dreissena polymorpha]